MKRKSWLLFIISLIFYALIHLSGHLPGLLRGQFTLVDERPETQRLLSLASSLTLSFFLSLSSYLFFFYYYAAKQYAKLFIGLIVMVSFCFLLGFIWDRAMEPYPSTISRYFRRNALFDALYIILGVVYYFVRYTRFRELQEKELQLQMRNAELSFLRSQINPHFLFNNLNNIYSLVYRGSSDALKAISSLSELLRYMLYYQEQTIPLQKEIFYIEKYIELQQLRYEIPTIINSSYPNDSFNVNIPALLLIPFIENAFKHGEPMAVQEWLRLIIAIEGSLLTFTCINKIGAHVKDSVGGIGIDNVKRRLALLYPNRHTLATSRHDDFFTVKMQLRYA